MPHVGHWKSANSSTVTGALALLRTCAGVAPSGNEPGAGVAARGGPSDWREFDDIFHITPKAMTKTIAMIRNGTKRFICDSKLANPIQFGYAAAVSAPTRE